MRYNVQLNSKKRAKNKKQTSMAVRTTKLGLLINLYNFMPPPLSRSVCFIYFIV